MLFRIHMPYVFTELHYFIEFTKISPGCLDDPLQSAIFTQMSILYTEPLQKVRNKMCCSRPCINVCVLYQILCIINSETGCTWCLFHIPYNSLHYDTTRVICQRTGHVYKCHGKCIAFNFSGCYLPDDRVSLCSNTFFITLTPHANCLNLHVMFHIHSTILTLPLTAWHSVRDVIRQTSPGKVQYGEKCDMKSCFEAEIEMLLLPKSFT